MEILSEIRSPGKKLLFGLLLLLLALLIFFNKKPNRDAGNGDASPELINDAYNTYT